MKTPPMSTWQERHEAFVLARQIPSEEPAFQAGYVMATNKFRKLWKAAHALREAWGVAPLDDTAEGQLAIIALRDAVDALIALEEPDQPTAS